MSDLFTYLVYIDYFDFLNIFSAARRVFLTFG
jgi:hypothetical protein